MVMKTDTLIRKMLENPAAMEELLNRCSTSQLQMFFPNHEITVKTKTVKSLMTGKDIVIPANTPIHLDPSSETYWSM